MANPELKTTQGIACLHGYLDGARLGTFLHRNLKRTLQHAQGNPANTNDIERSNSQEIGHWSPPPEEVLISARDNVSRPPSLKVEVKELVVNGIERPPFRSAPRKKAKYRSINCYVDVLIKDPTSPDQGIIFKNRQTGSIQVRGANENLKVDVRTDIVVVDGINFPVDIKRNSKWYLSLGASYSIELSVLFLTEQDATDFGQFLGHNLVPPTIKYFHMMRATWKHLPKCPGTRQNMPLVGIANGKEIDLGCSMRADLKWLEAKVRQSILQDHNKAWKKEMNPNHLPSPVSEPSISYNGIYVVYKLPDSNRYIDLEKWRCYSCNNRDLKDLDLLRLHLKHDHPENKFSCEVSYPHTNGYNNIFAKFTPSKDKTLTEAPRNFTWCAPSFESFDLKKYLDGDDAWIRRGSASEKKGQVRLIPPKVRFNSKRSPEQVKDMPTSKVRKTFAVPKAPSGVIFFRSVSKRIMEEGELLSESDGEIDVRWIASRRRKYTDFEDISEPAKRFMIKFDDFFERERLHGDLFVGDTLVRFVRKNKMWLGENALLHEFERKVTELHADRIISDQVFGFCKTTVRKIQTHIDRSSMSTTRRSATKIPSTVTPPHSPTIPSFNHDNLSTGLLIHEPRGSDDGIRMNITPQHRLCPKPTGQTSPMDNRNHSRIIVADRCKCGKIVENMRHGIFCENKNCTRYRFHLACVGLKQRKQSWKCDECIK